MLRPLPNHGTQRLPNDDDDDDDTQYKKIYLTAVSEKHEHCSTETMKYHMPGP